MIKLHKPENKQKHNVITLKIKYKVDIIECLKAQLHNSL